MIFSTRVVFLLFLALMVSAALLAQPAGSLRGQVLDPSAAAVPQATITITGPNSLVKVAQTDNSGNYVIVGLAPGKYTVRVSAAGFTLLERTDIDIPGGRPLTLDAKLALATEKQEITVAEAVLPGEVGRP